MPVPYPFLVSFCSIGLRNKPVSEALAQIAAAGFRGVEIWWPHLENLSTDEQRAAADQCKKLGLVPTVIAPYFAFTRGEEWRQRSIETARAVLKAAPLFEVKKIRTFVDIGPDGLPSARAQESDWQAATGGLRELCELDPTTELVIETHENTLADTLPTIQRLLKDVDRPNLKLNFQVGADFMERGYLKCLEILFPHVSHLHWEQVSKETSGAYIDEPGPIDFPELIGWLADRNYRGTASVEYCWNPVDESRIPGAVKYLDAVMEKLSLNRPLSRSSRTD